MFAWLFDFHVGFTLWPCPRKLQPLSPPPPRFPRPYSAQASGSGVLWQRPVSLPFLPPEQIFTRSFPDPSSSCTQSRRRHCPSMRNGSTACLRRTRSLRPAESKIGGIRCAKGRRAAGRERGRLPRMQQGKARLESGWAQGTGGVHLEDHLKVCDAGRFEAQQRLVECLRSLPSRKGGL